MPWSIFNETLRCGWRSMIYWGIGLGVLGLVIMIIIPNIAILKQFESLMTSMPVLLKAMGMEDAAQLATPEGFISAGYFGRVLLILAIYTVLSGLNITANDEDQGIMDVVLALPVPRSRLVLEKFAAYCLMLIGVLGLGLIGLYVGSTASNLEVDSSKLLISTINVLPSAILMLAFTSFAGTFFRTRSGAGAATVIFIVASYVVDFIGSAASDSFVAPLRSLSFFAYYDNAHIMQTGLNIAHVLLLLGLSFVFVVGSVWFFQRRDIGT